MSGRLDVQFVSVNHNKFIPFSQDPTKSAKKEPSIPNRLLSDPRTAKMALAFDLSAISDQLPPNTGPPGLVPVNGLTSNANANKNLRHVPCKFFRQGICQAGNSCPFSHNLEGSLGADKLPCKYFQKGNCKFGLKCALAHFLPDGTRVNSKSLYRRSERDRSNQQYQGSFSLSADNSQTTRPAYSGYSGNKSHSSSYADSFAPLAATARSSSFSDTMMQSGSFLESLGSSAFADAFAAPLSVGSGVGYSYKPLTDPLSEPIQISSNGSFQLSLGYLTLGQGATHSQFATSMRANSAGLGSSNERPTSMSHSNSFQKQKSTLAGASPGILSISSLNSSEFNTGISFQSPQSQFSTPYSKPFSRYHTSISPVNNFLQGHDALVTDSAIVDDGSDDDNAFFEDYVPASLNLILTPQERQRRKSRSQSGTLLLRPSVGLKDKGPEDVFLMD